MAFRFCSRFGDSSKFLSLRFPWDRSLLHHVNEFEGNSCTKLSTVAFHHGFFLIEPIEADPTPNSESHRDLPLSGVVKGQSEKNRRKK
jgi:hypothetical protein